MQITLFPSFNWIRALAGWLSSRTVELLIASRLIKSLSCKQTSSPLANSLALLYPALLLQSGFPNTIYSSWSSSHSSSSARLTEATLCGNGWANTKPISQKCSTWLTPKSFCGGSKGIELQGMGMTLCGNGYWGFTQDCSMLTLLVLPFLLLALISDKKLFHFRVPAVSCQRPFARSIYLLWGFLLCRSRWCSFTHSNNSLMFTTNDRPPTIPGKAVECNQAERKSSPQQRRLQIYLLGLSINCAAAVAPCLGV